MNSKNHFFNTHGKITKLPGGSMAFIDGIPDDCDHDTDGDWYVLISPQPDSDWGLTYKMKAKTIQRMRPKLPEHEAIRAYDEDLTGHYISGGCTSCSKCGKAMTPPFW